MRLRLRLRRRRPPDRFEAVVHGNVVTLLHDGAACFPAMLEAIAAAREEVLFEMYWFGSDRTGRRFADALMERARAGVDVRVIYDAVGSLEAEDALFDAMRAAGCQVHEYNPIAPWRQRFDLGLVNNRDHRKIIVVDRKVAFTGGLNVGDPWAPEDEGG
ncbi:partial putative cardiolipin synthase YwiE, partial [Anaerolineae bacterium]